jgi:hypothetical protein
MNHILVSEGDKLMASRNDFGTYNVVIRNIDRAIKKGTGYSEISNTEDLDRLVDRLKDQLESNRERWREMITNRNACQHPEFGNATYTVQSRIMGYCSVYERACKSCGYIETYSAYSEAKEEQVIPEWCNGAKKLYYNNFI